MFNVSSCASLEDVTLNPVTAYPFLILSEDRKQVKRGEKLQFFRTSPQRFDVWSCVIAKEGYNSGRHYWEVRTRIIGVWLDRRQNWMWIRLMEGLNPAKLQVKEQTKR